MKAARLYNAGETFRIEEIEKPKLEKGTAIVKVKAAGVCGTELDFIEGIFPINPSPLVPGHEISGIIDEIDEDVKTTFKKGDKVVVYNVMNCGTCYYCRNGMENACPDRKGQIGFTADGGFEEYVQVPVASLLALPANVSFEAGAVLTCSGMTAVHSSRVVGTKMGDTVVVNGVGGVGIMCIQVAKICGARVIAVADSQSKKELAESVGADEVIVINDYSKLGNEVRKITDGFGADVCYDLVGTTESFNGEVDALGIGGRLMIIGYQKEDHLNIYPVDLLVKEGKIFTSVAGCKCDVELALQYANEGRITTAIANKMPLEKINDAIQLIVERKVRGRSVIVMD